MEQKTSGIFCEKRGRGARKILLVHGFGASRKSYYDIAPLLEDRYELLLIDLVGWGDSPAPEGWEFKPQEQAGAVYEFIKENNLSGITVIGHSYGGMITLLLLLKLEETKEQSLVKNAVLIDPASYMQGFPFFVKAPRMPLLKTLMNLIPVKTQVKYTLGRLIYDKSRITDERIERYACFHGSRKQKGTVAKSARNIIPDNRELLENRIKTISARTLIIRGDRDIIIPRSNIERLNRELKNSKLVILENAGHMPHEEKPEETCRAITEFIQ